MKMTRAEIRITAIIVGVLAVLGFSRADQPAFFWCCVLAVGVVFAVTARTLGELLLTIAVGGTLLGVLAPLSGHIFQGNPLRDKIAAKSFDDAPLVDILAYLSQQKEGFPKWWFYVWDEELARSRVSVTFQNGETLDDALAAVGAAARSEFAWHWFSMCGNASTPTGARFRLWPASMPQPDSPAYDYAVWVDSHDVFWVREEARADAAPLAERAPRAESNVRENR